MNKSITIAASVVAGVALPLLGLTVSPTRDAILGLAPDQAVLELADQIDENRVSTEQTDAKLAELQSVIDSQKAELASYQEQVDSQSSKINSVKAENQATQSKVNNQAECSKLYAEEPLCQSDSRYRTKSAFDKMLKELEISEKGKEQRTKIYENCKQIIAKCG